MDDIRAVMDGAGSERAVVCGVSEGGPMALMFAATYPERTQGLIIYGSLPRFVRGPGLPLARAEARVPCGVGARRADVGKRGRPRASDSPEAGMEASDETVAGSRHGGSDSARARARSCS